MPNEWTQLSPKTKVLSFVRLIKHTGLGYYIGEGLSDAKPLHPCSSDRPHLLSRHEALAFARGVPEIEALERAAQNFFSWIRDSGEVTLSTDGTDAALRANRYLERLRTALTNLKGDSDGA